MIESEPLVVGVPKPQRATSRWTRRGSALAGVGDRLPDAIHRSAWMEGSEKFGRLIGPNLFTSSDLYAPPQHVDPSWSAWWASEAILAALGGRSMHDPATQLPRMPLPRTPVNKGEMRKCLTLVNSTEQLSKDRRARS